MNFYKGIFGGEFLWQQTYGECPMKDQTPEDCLHLLMHCALPINKTYTLMANDVHPVLHKNKLVVGNNFEIVLNPDTRTEADRLFAALSEGGSVRMAMQDMFWGSYSGNCTDQFGVQWLIDTPNSSGACAGDNKEDSSVAEKETSSNKHVQTDKIEEPQPKKLKFDQEPEGVV